jgi:membrane-associated phospholipid phosphatase
VVGHAAHSFGIFTFLFFLVADVTPELFRPMVFALIYTFPAVCAGSRIRDHQHHLHDVVIGSILGTIIGKCVLMFSS